MAKKSFFARAKAAAKRTLKEVREVVADFIKPEPEPRVPRPPPTKRATPVRPNLGPELQEIRDSLTDDDFFRASTGAKSILKRHPNNSEAQSLLARANAMRDGGAPKQLDIELDRNIGEMGEDERDAYLTGMQRDNVMGILRAEGVSEDILETMDAVSDWSEHHAFEVHHDGLISDPAEGTAPGDRTDIFVGSISDCARQMAFWAENGEIFSVKISKLSARVDNWRPLWEGESVQTADGGIRGTQQGSGKKKHTAKRGRPAKRRGQHTAENARLTRRAEAARKARAKKSNEKRDSILWKDGPTAARRFMAMVEKRRKAALKRKPKK